MIIQPEYKSFKNRCKINSSNKFQAHPQRSQRRNGLSHTALVLIVVSLPFKNTKICSTDKCFFTMLSVVISVVPI